MGLNHSLDGELLHSYRDRVGHARARSDAGLREANLARQLGITVEELRYLDAVIDRRLRGVPE